MRSPINQWELWKDGSIRLTTKSNLLHLMVEQGLDGGWHYQIIQLGGERVRASKKPIATQLEAQQLCAKAAREILRHTLKGLEGANDAVSIVKAD